jgi:predicted membrane channel-forming protein YqfA (hemolysin III family)
MPAETVVWTSALTIVILPTTWPPHSNPTGIAEYVLVAWLSASMGTIAGALGSGLAANTP